jgi:hypothetical protein
MRILVAVLLLGSSIGSEAQKGTGYSRVNKIMSRIPDTLTHSTEGIAGYIDVNFSTQKEKSRAIYAWIARNIRYDFDVIFSVDHYPEPAEISETVLKTRTGVCLHYANLFSEIATKTGIKSYVIQGYTKQHGVVAYLPHVWCAAFIDSTWYLFDPTWGGGYTVNGRFVGQVNNYYFMTKPEELIRTHMPFDPMWQFLNYPVTNQEFYKGNKRVDKNRPFFNFPDTLDTYEQESEIERFISSARRIEQNGVTNSFLAAKLRVLKGEIEYYRDSTNADKYDTAVNLYNEGIKRLNRFIGYRNKQYKPEMDSARIIEMLDSTEYLFNASDKKLGEIKEPNLNAIGPVIELSNAIGASLKVLNEQRAAVSQYLKNRR